MILIAIYRTLIGNKVGYKKTGSMRHYVGGQRYYYDISVGGGGGVGGVSSWSAWAGWRECSVVIINALLAWLDWTPTV